MAPNTEDQDSRDSVEVEELKTSPSAIWTAEEKAILKDSIAGYRNATKKLKGAYIVQTVIPKVKASWKGRYGKRNMARDPVAKGEWAKKKKQVFTWFSNHAATSRKMKIPGFNDKVMFDSVVRFHKKEEIENLAKSMAGPEGANDTRKWLPFFQKAKKEVKENLSDEEAEEYLKEVEEWENNGVPVEVQMRNAEKYGKRMLFHMDKLRWNSMRMRSVGFECHLMSTGKYGISFFDTQDVQPNTPSVPTFAVFNPGAFSAFREAFTAYVRHIAMLEKGPPNNAEAKLSESYTMENMTYATSGMPLLPASVKNEFGTETKKIQQSILRTFLTKHYILASGKNNAKVPFKRIAESPTEFISGLAMPPNIVFKDPSLYRVEETTMILSLWRARQSKNIIPFHFNNIASGQNIAIAEYPERMFDSWVHPTSNERTKLKMVPERSLEPDDISESAEDDDHTDNVRLPEVAWSSPSSSDAEPTETLLGDGPHVPDHTDHLLSPPPTEMSDSLISPIPNIRNRIKNILISEDEHTPEPTMPIAKSTVETHTTRHRGRGRPKGTPEVLLTRRGKRRQLETPGPSDTATPGTTDTGTPNSTPGPAVRKSSRIRKGR